MAQNREPLRSTDNVMGTQQRSLAAAAAGNSSAQKDLNAKVLYYFSLYIHFLFIYIHLLSSFLISFIFSFTSISFPIIYLSSFLISVNFLLIFFTCVLESEFDLNFNLKPFYFNCIIDLIVFQSIYIYIYIYSYVL